MVLSSQRGGFARQTLDFRLVNGAARGDPAAADAQDRIEAEPFGRIGQRDTSGWAEAALADWYSETEAVLVNC